MHLVVQFVSHNYSFSSLRLPFLFSPITLSLLSNYPFSSLQLLFRFSPITLSLLSNYSFTSLQLLFRFSPITLSLLSISLSIFSNRPFSPFILSVSHNCQAFYSPNGLSINANYSCLFFLAQYWKFKKMAAFFALSLAVLLVFSLDYKVWFLLHKNRVYYKILNAIKWELGK